MGGIGNNEPFEPFLDFYDAAAPVAPANTTRIARIAGNLAVSTNCGAYQTLATGVPGANNILTNPADDPKLPFIDITDGAESVAPTNRMRLARQAGNLASSLSSAAYATLATGVPGANSIVPTLQPMELIDLWDSACPVAPANTTRLALRAGVLMVSTDCGAYQAVAAGGPPGSPVLWFDGQDVDGLGNSNAALIDGQQIGTWVNKGSLGVGANAIQATAGIRPLFRKIAAAGKLNNLSALEGDGTKQLASAAFASQAQPMTWAIVARSTGVAAQIFFSGPGGGHAHQLFLGGLAISIFAGSIVATGQSIVANTFHHLGMVGNGASSSGNKDGVSVGPVAGGANDVTGVSIFADTTPASFLIGFVAELIAWQGASPPSLAAIASYLTTKYGAFPQ